MPVRYLAISLLLISLAALFLDFVPAQSEPNYTPGEQFEYRVKLGFVPVGLATVEMHKQLQTVYTRPTYQVKVLGRTTGLTDVFRVRNTYQTNIDTATFLPQRFIYHAKEGDYERLQTVRFLQQANKALRTEKGEQKQFTIPRHCQDVVSAYYYLRNLPLERMASGQMIEIPLFFTDEVYSLKARFKGRKVIKTNFGKLRVFQLVPIIPSNSLFGGEEAISIWISDDNNRVPVQIDVAFKVGRATFELRKFKGQKYPFEWI